MSSRMTKHGGNGTYTAVQTGLRIHFPAAPAESHARFNNCKSPGRQKVSGTKSKCFLPWRACGKVQQTVVVVMEEEEKRVVHMSRHATMTRTTYKSKTISPPVFLHCCKDTKRHRDPTDLHVSNISVHAIFSTELKRS